MRFFIPTPHRSSFSLYICLLLISLYYSTHVRFSSSGFASCGVFSKTKRSSGGSQKHQQANHRCLKSNAYHNPLQRPLVIDQTGSICLPRLFW